MSGYRAVAVALFVCACISGARAQESISFYVSPTGDDAHPGTLAKPFRTVMRARTAVRSVKWRQSPDYKENRVGNITVYLRGGRYYHAGPIVFTGNDSGNYGFTITYRNYQDEVPVLIGGIKLPAQWKRDEGNIYKIELPMLGNGLLSFYQLFENDKPAEPARAPNEGWFRMVNPEENRFHYRPGDFDPTGWDADGMRIKQMELAWFSSYQEVEGFDTATRQVTLRERPNYPFSNKHKSHNLTYCISGALPLLDQPGEFHHDRRTGTLYYWPYGENINQQEIVVPTVESVIRFDGRSWQYPVRNVVLQGLQIQVSKTAVKWSNGWPAYGDNGHPWNKEKGGETQDRHSYVAAHDWGLVHLNNAERITVKDCRLLFAGMQAVSLTQGAAFNRIEGCEIAYSGMNGIQLSGPFASCNPEDARMQTDINHHNVVHNNFIHHLGRLYIMGSGVRLYNTSYAEITNNRFADLAKSGVLMFHKWSASPEQKCLYKTTIRNNDFIRTQTQATDGGAWYIGATTQDTVFDNNRIVDAWTWRQNTYSSTDQRANQTMPIDFDPGNRGCFNTRITNNMLYGPLNWVMELGKEGVEQTLENNYVEEFHRRGRDGSQRPVTHASFARQPDMSKIKPKSIGLTSDFTYPVPPEPTRLFQLPLEESFEGSLGATYMFRYSGGINEDVLHEYLSKTPGVAKSGEYALTIDRDIMMVRYRHPAPVSSRIAVWFHDRVEKENAQALVFVRNGPSDLYWHTWNKGIRSSADEKTTHPRYGWSSAPSEEMLAVGVDGTVSKSKYVFCVDGKPVASSIARSDGWHLVEIDVTASGSTVRIDGKTAGKAPLRAFNSIDLGDHEFGSDSRGLGFDLLRVGKAASKDGGAK